MASLAEFIEPIVTYPLPRLSPVSGFRDTFNIIIRLHCGDEVILLNRVKEIEASS